MTAPINVLDLDGWSRRSCGGGTPGRAAYTRSCGGMSRQDLRPSIWIDGTRRPVRTVEAHNVQIAARLGILAIMVRDGMTEAVQAHRHRTAQVRSDGSRLPAASSSGCCP